MAGNSISSLLGAGLTWNPVANKINVVTAPVTSVVGRIGDIKLTPGDITNFAAGVLAATPVRSVNGYTGDVQIAIPTRLSQLSNDAGYLQVVPRATPTVVGGIKVGAGLTIAVDGTVSVSPGALPVPLATPVTIGGVRIGDGLLIDGNGILSVNQTLATQATAGVVKIGSGLSVGLDGTISTTPYVYPNATSTQPGLVRPGPGLAVDLTGMLTVTQQINYAMSTLTSAGAVSNSDYVGVSVGGADQKLSISTLFGMVQAALSGISPTGPAVYQVYQRDTVTGGVYGLGSGYVQFAMTSLFQLSNLQYRLVDASNTANVLVDWTNVGSTVAAGTSTISVNIPASNYVYTIDFGVNGYKVAGVNNPFSIGTVIAVAGSSLAGDFLQPFSNDTATTLTSLGYTASGSGTGTPIAATGYEYASWQADNLNPTWGLPSLTATDSTVQPYHSAGAAEFLRLMVAKTGVPCALVGHAVAGSTIASWVPPGSALNSGAAGANWAQLKAILQAGAKKIGGFVWLQGDQDAIAATDPSAYETALKYLINDATNGIASLCSAPLGAPWAGSFKRIIGSIPSVVISDGTRGTAGHIEAIRAAALAVVETDSNAVAVPAMDLYPLFSDQIHVTQQGMMRLGRAIYRAYAGAIGLLGSNSYPVIVSAEKDQGATAIINLTVALSGSATALEVWSADVNGNWTINANAKVAANQFSVYTTATPFDASGNLTATPLALDATTPLTIDAASGGQVKMHLKLAATQADTVPLYVFYRLPFDTNGVSGTAATIITDNSADNDGVPVGRQLSMVQAGFSSASPSSVSRMITSPAPNTNAPGQVTGLDTSSIPTATTLSVSWTAPIGLVTDYTVSYATNIAGPWTVASNAVPTGTYNYTITGLTQQTEYYITVQAYNGSAGGPVSAIYGPIGTPQATWPVAYPMDNLVTASKASLVAVWSLRKLSASYAGKAVQANNLHTAATQDIGFSGVSLDEGTLVTFSTAATSPQDVVATLWYDQSGNGHNLAPYTVAGGKSAYLCTAANSIPFLNVPNHTVPAMQFFSTLGSAMSAAVDLTGSAMTVVAAVQPSNPEANNTVMASYISTGHTSATDNTASAEIITMATAPHVEAKANGADLSGADVTLGVPLVVASVFDGTNHTLTVNGTASTSVPYVPAFGSGHFSVGAAADGTLYAQNPFDGMVSEVWVFKGIISDLPQLLLDMQNYWTQGIGF